MNNNRCNTPALEASCKGVFSSCGFLDVGEDSKYSDSKPIERDSYKGKQFVVPQERTGKTLDTYFGLDNSKKHLYIAEGLPFIDRVRFAESQPEKPGKGFLTSDYNKRGEFTDTIRTEQYRQQLKAEEKLFRKRQADAPQAETALVEAAPTVDSFLYDRVYDQSKPAHNAQKLTKDTTNPTSLTKERFIGPYNTTYLLTHTAPGLDQLHRPEHGRMVCSFAEKEINI